MMDFLRFKKMIMPYIIQILYWLCTVLVIITGFYIIFARQSLSKGLIIIILGPLVIRLICEIIMVYFRSYQTLLNIEESLDQSLFSPHNPVTPRQGNVAPGTKVAPLFDIITSGNKTAAPQESPPTS
jgi:hypothetical protein